MTGPSFRCIGYRMKAASARGRVPTRNRLITGREGSSPRPADRLGRRYDRLYGLAREILRAGASRSAMLKRYAAVDPGSLATSGFKSLSRNNHATPSEDFGF